MFFSSSTKFYRLLSIDVRVFSPHSKLVFMVSCECIEVFPNPF